MRFQPLSAFSRDARRAVRVVLCDIDDTLTTDGQLTASAYEAMERLARAGVAVVPVTGRPAGWCDLIARLWPVAGVVGENGAFYFHHDKGARRVVRRYWQDEEERRSGRARLAALAERLLDAVPGAGIASDQAYRETDLAIDWSEDVDPLGDEERTRLIALAREAGATVKLSSIHINIWFGEFDKLRMTRRLLQEVLGADPDGDPGAFAFVGDSPNDAPMFGFFPNAVGVANVLDFRGRIESEPAYVTDARGGDGFAELGKALLEAR
jgi:HAD superfamily hydrolase (TIGR01484 family)